MIVSATLKRLFVFPLVLVAAIVLALWTAAPPAAQLKAPVSGVSLTNLAATVDAIAVEPHPASSPQNKRVQDYLVTQLTGLGLKVEIQRADAVRQSQPGKRAIAVGRIENIIAVLPGRDARTPAVALMAHYDSVPFAAGAGDDASGTAAVIETARLLAAGPKPERDVVFLITDGEEFGLLGAQAFFEDHALAPHVGAVVNVEARGSKGRAMMFETSRGNAALIDLWANTAISPSGNSLSDAIYKRLPNDTDLSVSIAAGRIGINAAFIDGQFDYHAPSDTPANLNQATLQHLGNFAFTTTRALAFSDQLPAIGKDSAFFDVFGLGVVRYPLAMGWLLLVVAAAGIVMVRVGAIGTTWRRSVVGMFGVLTLTIIAAAVCHAVGLLLAGAGSTAMREQLAESGMAFWIYVLLCFGFTMFMRPRTASWVGAMLLIFIGGVAMQILLPGGNWLLIWPLLVTLGVALLAERFGIDAALVRIVAALAGLLAFGLIFQIIALFYVSVGTMTPAIVALLIPFMILLLGQSLTAWSDGLVGRKTGAGLLAIAGCGTLWLGLTDGFSARHPRPGDLFHYTDNDSGKSYWATTSSRADLPSGIAKQVKVAVYDQFSFWTVPAPKTDVPRPILALTRLGTHGTLSITGTAPPRLLMLALRPSQPLRNARISGKAVTLGPAQWTRIAFRTETPVNLALDFDAPSGGTLVVRYLWVAPDMPAGAPRPKGPTTNWTLFSDARVAAGSTQLSLDTATP